MPLRRLTEPLIEPVSLADAKSHLRTGTAEDAYVTMLIAAARAACEERLNRSLVATQWVMSVDSFADCIPLYMPRVLGVQSVKYVDTNGATQTLAATEYLVDLESEPGRLMLAYGKSWPTVRDQVNAVTITYTAGSAAPITASDATANSITVPQWRTLVVGDPVTLSSAGGTLPAPLVAGVTYYVQSVVSAGVYTLAATAGGAVIDITVAGTGALLVGVVPQTIRQWILLQIGAMFENREAVMASPGITPVDLGFAERLLDAHRVFAL